MFESEIRSDSEKIKNQMREIICRLIRNKNADQLLLQRHSSLLVWLWRTRQTSIPQNVPLIMTTWKHRDPDVSELLTARSCLSAVGTQTCDVGESDIRSRINLHLLSSLWEGFFLSAASIGRNQSGMSALKLRTKERVKKEKTKLAKWNLTVQTFSWGF